MSAAPDVTGPTAVVLDAERPGPVSREPGQVLIGVSADRDAVPAGHLDVLAHPNDVDRLRQAVEAQPAAAATLCQVLRATARMPVDGAVLVESLAYSTLLAGAGFAAWRTARRPIPESPGNDSPPVLLERTGDIMTITLNRPERHNAFGRQVRDALLEALQVPALDPSVREVVLTGAGPSLCSGGDLDEFGTAGDPAAAHQVRMAAHAGLAVHRLRERVRPVLHGACIGAGIEITAFAARVTARPDAFVQLPELSMGLIPGAGGTVSLSRRIGRHRTAWLALTGDRIDAATALSWGLVDQVG